MFLFKYDPFKKSVYKINKFTIFIANNSVVRLSLTSLTQP